MFPIFKKPREFPISEFKINPAPKCWRLGKFTGEKAFEKGNKKIVQFLFHFLIEIIEIGFTS